VFIAPGQVTELRALNVGGSRIVSRFFDHDHLVEMAKMALELENNATGVYFLPNPLRSDATSSPRRVARDQDVIGRKWLLIDCDPVRCGLDGRPLEDQKVPSTEEERRASWEVLDRCRTTMDDAGFTGAVVGDSGNGWHLCYPIDLPNDEAARDQIKSILRGLHQRCSDIRARVDTSTFNASRIWKLYGTLARKGQASDRRPFRRSWLAE
jgi:hypothetical protein